MRTWILNSSRRIAGLLGLIGCALAAIACSGGDSGGISGEEEGDSPSHDGDLDAEEREADPAVEEELNETEEWPENDPEIEEFEEGSDGEIEIEPDPSDRALVFAINPVATPEPMEVYFDSVADDADGSLQSAADADEVRRLRVVSCVDEGATNTINIGNGPVTQRICTLKPRVDRALNGDFVYRDWSDAVAGVYDPDEVHAEIELYYHADRMYRWLTQPAVGLWERMPERHFVDGHPVPLTLVANYRLPNADGDLKPVSMSMFMPESYRRVGMGAIYGLTGFVGDSLIFGQGENADFAYDGETVYHEFAHWVNFSLAGLTHDIQIDEYGLSNLFNALEQGISETFVAMVSGRTMLFDYLDTVAGPGFLREVNNTDRFPDSLEGFDQFDGLIVAGALWECFQRLCRDFGFDGPRWTRVLLLTLTSYRDQPKSKPFDTFFRLVAETIRTEVSEEASQAALQIFTARGLFQTERCKPLPGAASDAPGVLLVGSALDASFNTVLSVRDGEETDFVSTAFVQLYLEAETDRSGATFSTILSEMPDTMNLYPDEIDWDLRLYVRTDQPVLYQTDLLGTTRVQKDATLIPEYRTVETPMGPRSQAVWTLPAQKSGTRIYLHLVNFGKSPVVCQNIEVLK